MKNEYWRSILSDERAKNIPRIELLFHLKEKVYLGDGLYAEYDGYQIWLIAPRENGEHRVALEPSVLEAFEAYADKVTLIADFIRQLDKENQ